MSPADLGLAGFDDEEEIGRGAFGVVYRARQIDLDRPVAIKILLGVSDQHALDRFDRERRSLGALSSHPNIVDVYSSGVGNDGRPFIVMEHLSGGSLSERLQREQTLTPGETAAMGAKLADALHAAHEAGVLHRDVKPENILFTAYGEPVLADFGIARLAGGPETRTGVVTASVMHAPPEVLDGQRPLPESDVYSLASTLFAAVSGRAPFVRASDESMIPVIARVAIEPPPDLRTQGVPAGLCAVLERGLAKDPAARPSAAELAAALRDWEAYTPPPDGGAPVAPAPDADAEPPSTRRRGLLVPVIVAAVLVAAAVAFFALRGGDDGASTAAVERIEGADRFATAAAIARATFEKADEVVVVRSDLAADGLAACFLAGSDGGKPLLYSTPLGLDDATTDAITALGATRAIVVGDPTAVPTAVDDELAGLGVEVRRVEGTNRFDTARAIARAGGEAGSVPGEGPTAIIGNGDDDDFSEVLAAGPLCYGERLPLLYTASDALSPDTAAALEDKRISHVILIGGEAAVPVGIETELRNRGLRITRLDGGTPSESASEIAEFEETVVGWTTAHLTLVRGDAFPDAVVASAHAGSERSPMLLTVGIDTLGRVSADHLRGLRGEADSFHVIGDATVISDAVVDEAAAAAGVEQ